MEPSEKLAQAAITKETQRLRRLSMDFGSSNGWSGLTNSSWQIWLIVALCLVGIGTIAYGSKNTANGIQALNANTTGGNNTANGYEALYSNTTGYHNTANGYQALNANTTGAGNTVNGYQAGQHTADGVTTNQTSSNPVMFVVHYIHWLNY